MKLGRIMYNDKVQVPFEDELNRFIRTEVTEDPYLYFFLLRPFDSFFSEVTSPFLSLERLNAISFLKNTVDFNNMGGPGMCSTEHTKF